MRLIDADMLDFEKVEEEHGSRNPAIIACEILIDNAPTIDAEPVVRCKDCVSFRYSGMGGDNETTYCAPMGLEMQPTDFCSYGERKDNETD